VSLSPGLRKSHLTKFGRLLWRGREKKKKRRRGQAHDDKKAK
jgi:hypothetical protein